MTRGGGLFPCSPGLLILADGTVFRGHVAVTGPPVFGEVVFNTALSGYQEIITDPSYAGQIVVMTYPHIGNYGCNSADNEAVSPAATGLVVREMTRKSSNHRAEEDLPSFLHRHGMPALDNIDTRRLTRHLRAAGAMTGGLFTRSPETEGTTRDLVQLVTAAPEIEGQDMVSKVTTPVAYLSPFQPDETRFRVHLLDLGVKRTILRRLALLGCTVTVWPAATPAEEILADEPDGIMLSNGPGDPAAVPYAVSCVQDLLGRVPVFGICLGHQILSLALGAETFKLPFGHHGANHPVMDHATGRIEVTSQNHGFSVSFADLANLRGETPFGRVERTHTNLNDNTLEGVRCLDIPAFGVQYHPEAGPGPHDAVHIFNRFLQLLSAAVSKTGRL